MVHGIDFEMCNWLNGASKSYFYWFENSNSEKLNRESHVTNNEIEGITYAYIYTTDNLQDVDEIWTSWIEISLFPSLRLIEW